LLITGGGANGKYTPEELQALSIDDVKKMILQQEPRVFDKKAPAKKAATKKAPSKKQWTRRSKNFIGID
jgi:DNA topoisomerase I